MRRRCQSGSQESRWNGPTPKPHNSVMDTPWVCPDLYILDPGSWLLCNTWTLEDGATGSPKGGAIAFPKLMPYGRKYSTQEVGKWLSTSIVVVVPSAILLELQIPVSPLNTLVCSALPVPEPRVSGCERDFVHWPFKSVPVSLTDLNVFLVNRIPAVFHSQILCGHLFLGLMLWAGDPSLGLRPHTSQRGTPCSWDICRLLPPFSHFCPSYQSWCGFFCKSLAIRLLFS